MKDLKTLPEEEQLKIIAQREYFKKYRKENKEKIKEAQLKYWAKKGKMIVAGN